MTWNKLLVFILISMGLLICTGYADEKLAEKARDIHRKILTIDSHCDTPLRFADSTWDIAARHQPGENKSGKIDLPRMKEGGLDVQFFAVFVAQRERRPESYDWASYRADELISAIKNMCDRNGQTIRLALAPDDAYYNEKKELLSAYIGMENGFPIGKDLKNISRYYDLGVRYITLCHTENNDICDSSTDPKGPEHHGLSAFGRQVVAEMNRIGMMIDVSHISDASFKDVIKLSKAPVIASHSCVRALCDNPRNLSDEMLNALAANGGVIQIAFFSDYLKILKPNPPREQALKALADKYGPWSNIVDPEVVQRYRSEMNDVNKIYPREKATLQDLVDHIDYVVRHVGIDYVGIGTDFDGGGGVIGCDEVSEMPNITLELLKRGYSKGDIKKIWGGNFMRVFRKVNKIAQLSH